MEALEPIDDLLAIGLKHLRGRRRIRSNGTGG